MNERGYLEGSEMANTFNMLRANDLIWSFVINNYLLGRDPFPFDLLHWNCDSTRMPAAMHSYYLRNMYMKNLLREPGALTLGRVPDRLVEDRRRPPTSSRRSRTTSRRGRRRTRAPQLLGGKNRVRALGLGSHRRHGESAGREQVRLLDQRQAARTAGCLVRGREAARRLVVAELARVGHAATSGAKCPRACPGKGKLKVIEAAPGTYARIRADAK